MIANTIICQIHVSRLTAPLSNELNCSCCSTEILTLLTMKLEFLSPLQSDSQFLSSKDFLFSRFSNVTVEWTKWNHARWGPRKLSILNSFLVFPRPVNFVAVGQFSVGMKNSQKLSSKTSSETLLVSMFVASNTGMWFTPLRTCLTYSSILKSCTYATLNYDTLTGTDKFT